MLVVSGQLFRLEAGANTKETEVDAGGRRNQRKAAASSSVWFVTSPSPNSLLNCWKCEKRGGVTAGF